MDAHCRHPTRGSVLVGSALLAAVAAAWPLAADARRPQVPAPTVVRLIADTAAPAAAPLTQQQLAKIQKFIGDKRREGVIDPETAKVLGLGDGKPVKVLQVALVEKDKKTRHVFDRLEDDSGFLIGKRTAEGFALYRLDNALNWVASVQWRKDGNKVALRSTDAASGLRQELELWARFADRQK